MAPRCRILEQRQPGMNALGHVGHAPRRAFGFGQRGGFQKIEGVRPHHHRAAAGGGLNQVLPAQWRKAAAQQSRVTQAVVQRHLAQRVAEPHVC